MKQLIYPFFNYLTLGSFISLFLIFCCLLSTKIRRKTIVFFNQFGFWIIFLVSLIATFGSLSFSEILGWAPCKLCWYQRIFMYPQVLLSLIAIKIKDKRAFFYHFWFSLIGFLISLFHYLIQWEIIKGIDCNLVSSSESCFLKTNFTFGFISIPFMALTAFLIILIISFLNWKTKKN